LIPALRIKGQPVSLAEIEAAPDLPRSAYVATPDGRPRSEPKSGTWARDAMIERLMESGDSPSKARAIADRTATQHDRRSR